MHICKVKVIEKYKKKIIRVEIEIPVLFRLFFPIEIWVAERSIIFNKLTAEDLSRLHKSRLNVTAEIKLQIK